MSGDHSPGRTVLAGSDGSCRRTSARDGSLPLPKREVDSEELTRRGTARGAPSIVTTSAARQHPGRGVLRLRRYGDAQTTDDRKTTGHAAPRHGRVAQDAGTGSGGSRAELPGTLGSVGRSTVELARESGTRAAAE